jgi:hypothetical protein
MGPEFNKSLRKVAVPKLKSLGFNFDDKRRFVKPYNHKIEQIIEYQIGTRFMSGQFTVNLIIGDSFERLAILKPTLFSKFVNRLFGNYDPWWKGLFLPKDNWWKISPFQKEMDTIIKKTTYDLENFGISWFEDKLCISTQEHDERKK